MSGISTAVATGYSKKLSTKQAPPSVVRNALEQHPAEPHRGRAADLALDDGRD